MRKMRRERFVAMILTVVLFLSMLPSMAFAATYSGTCGENLTWKFDNHVLTISGEGDMCDYTYDSEWGEPTCPWYDRVKTTESVQVVIEEGVTSIGSYAFYGLPIIDVEISDSVASIGYRAFNSCNSLAKVKLGTGLENVGNGAFSGCYKLAEVYAPSIEEWCEIRFWDGAANPLCNSEVYDVTTSLYFDNVKTTNLVIPETVTVIPSYSFYHFTQLESVELHDGITEIGDGAFSESSLSAIEILSGIETIGNNVFQYCEQLEEVVLPENLQTIAWGMFAGCTSLKTINVPESVTEFKTGAFGGCTSLTEINIPEEVQKLGASVFHHCSSLQEVIIPEGVTSIGNSTFRECTGLETVTIPDSVESFGTFAFYNCSNLDEINIPNGVTVLPWNALYGCSSLTEIVLPESLVEIGDYALSGCSGILQIEIPEGVKTIGNFALSCSGLTEVTLPSTIETLGTDVFSCRLIDNVYWNGSMEDWLNVTFGSAKSNPLWNGANLYAKDALVTEIEVADTATEIKPYALRGCESLEKITFPEDLLTIGDSAFANCTSLTDVYYEGSNVQWNNISIGEDNTYLINAEIHFASSELASGTCGENLQWSLNTDGVLEIYGSGEMTSWTNEESVEWYALKSSIVELVIKDGVTSIGKYAFYGCNNLKDVSIADTVVIINDSAFKTCEGLETISIPDSVTTIGQCAYDYCVALAEIEFPTTMDSIGWGAFRGCDSLKDVTLPEGIGPLAYTFCSCDGLERIVLPQTSIYFAEGVFMGCKNLKTVIFTGDAPSFYYAQFDGYYQFEDVVADCYYPLNNDTWDSFGKGNYGGTLTWNGYDPTSEGDGGGDGENVGEEEGEDSDVAGGSGDGSGSGDSESGDTDSTGGSEDGEGDSGEGGSGEGGSGEGGSSDGDSESGSSNKIEITVNNVGSETTGATIGTPTDGWVEGNNTFTVTCESACVVGVSNDGGSTYTRLTATATEEENTYSFTVDNMTSNTILSVLLLGDVNGDGEITTADLTKLKAVVLGKTTMDNLNILAGDTNGTGDISTSDVTKLKAVLLGKTSLSC